MRSDTDSINILMNRLLDLTTASPVAGQQIEVILEFMGLRPPYRLDLMSGDRLRRGDPRCKVFEAQLTYILNTGGMMFVLTPLPLQSLHTGPNGEPIAMESWAVSAVRFQSGRWFPIPADQIDPLFERPNTGPPNVIWLFRDFPRR